MRARPLRERFEEKYLSGAGCWLWTGSKNSDGYGTVRADERISLAHRVAWQLAFGLIPNGMCVLHRCDMPACVRPDHLWLGSHQDNMRDRDRKGRSGSEKRNGERHGRAKLTEKAIVAIRQAYAMGVSQYALARRFNVNSGTINGIVRRITWVHVE